jgi:hypothetical protein
MSLISAFSRAAAAFLLHYVPAGLSVAHSSYDLHMPDMPKQPRQHELEDESRFTLGMLGPGAEYEYSKTIDGISMTTPLERTMR